MSGIGPRSIGRAVAIKPVRSAWSACPDPSDWSIALVETATAFGGKRQWFQCLSCNGRCRVLYGGAYFRCRRCHRLKYETQYEPPFARAATRALKIRERLGGTGGIGDIFPNKPKGMHWRTYERLQAEEERLQHGWAVGIAQKFQLFGGRD